MILHNFNSGPSILPTCVLEKASKALFNFENTGLSILEIGHRTPAFIAVLQEARALVKELLGLGDAYDVFFMQGGATQQFMQVPINFLGDGETAAYTKHGIWGAKAIAEAAVWGKVDVVSDSSSSNYDHIDKNFILQQPYAYLHITTNNTVEGTQWHTLPDTKNIPLVADMSSDIFSKERDYNKFSLIYAGAQKNVGAAGTTLVIVKKQWLEKKTRSLSPILDYRCWHKADALPNTAPVFAIYIALLTLRWIKDRGGISKMESLAQQKSQALYACLDCSSLYVPLAQREDRSLMNITFKIENEKIQQQFLEACDANGVIGIKGYRTMGGLRVSLYNALPMESVEALIDFMTRFEQNI